MVNVPISIDIIGASGGRTGFELAGLVLEADETWFCLLLVKIQFKKLSLPHRDIVKTQHCRQLGMGYNTDPSSLHVNR